MPCYCIVLNCQTPSRAKGRSYCRIPAIITNQGEETQRLSEERRRLWLAAINRGELTENTLQHARVCGAHFVSGKAAPLWNRTSVDWVPTLNLRLQTISVDEERAQERAWRQFTKRRRIREAGHEMIGAHSSEGKCSSGVQAGGDTTAPSTSKRARVSDSLHHGGEDLHGASDHVSEEDSTPMVGTLGFSKETTLALLNRMFTEELLSELNRRSIVVKPAGGDRPRGRSDLEHVLREVMTREYEEAEGHSGISMDTSNTSSTFKHSRSDASSSFEHSSRLDEETSGSEAFSSPNNDQASRRNVQESTVTVHETSSRQVSDMNVSQAPSTSSASSSAYPVEVLVKKEPFDVEYCVATSSSSSNIVASTTEPSTSQTGHPGIGDGSQGRLARNLSQAERIKTESEVEEGTEDIEQEDLSSEHCPSSPGQLSQELDKVEVSTEDEGDAKPSTSTEEPVKKKRKTRKLREWDKEKIEEILQDIVENKLSVYAASKKHGVPRATLHRKIKGRTAMDAKLGRPRVMIQNEEDSIIYYMKYRAEHGFPTTKKTILPLALEVHLGHCAENGTAPKLKIDPQKGLSEKWWRRFKKRHSTILRQLDSLNNLSTRSVDKTKYFDQLTATMTKEGLTGQPHRIYNADEVGFDFDPKMEPLTFAKLNVPGAAMRTGSHDHKLSCLECVAADGAAIPPLITLSKSFPTTDYRSEGPDNALYAVTPSGLVEGDAFLRWLQECFLPFCSPVRPVLVLLDPSSSHVTAEVIDFASKHDIVFMALPFRTTVFRHPVDASFDRMKTKFHRAVKARLAPDFVVTKSSFCKIYNEARECLLSKAVIKKAFKKSGVTPVRENSASQHPSVANNSKGGDNHDDEAKDRYPALLPEEREMMARAEELEDEEYHRDKGRTHAVPEIDNDEDETDQLLEDETEDPSWM